MNKSDTKEVINLASVENVELSGDAVKGYVGWAFDKVSHYTWELTTLGAGWKAAEFGLGFGYEKVAALPLLSNVDGLLRQVQYLPETVGVIAPLFAAWRAKKFVDGWLAKHA